MELEDVDRLPSLVVRRFLFRDNNLDLEMVLLCSWG